MSSYRLYARLLGYAKPYWLAFAIAATALVLVAATETAFPALMKPLLDKGFSGVTKFQIWWVPAVIVLIFVVRGIASFLSTYMMSWVAGNLLRDLRLAMYDRILVMPASSFDNCSSGQLISRLVAEVNGVTTSATNVLNTLVRDSLILIGLLGWLLWLNWLLTLVVLCLAPVMVLLSLALSRRMRRVSRAAIHATGQLTRSVEETVTGQRLIKLFQSQEHERQRFAAINQDYRAQGMRVVIAQALQAPLSQLIVAVGVAFVVTIALIQARQSGASIGDFVSFITAMLLLLSPIRHLADVNAQLQRGLASAETVFGMIDERSEVDQGKRDFLGLRESIQFRGVHMHYASKREAALQGVNLSIQAGETVALVGPSGGGKTSLVNLIPRLYDPTMGAILFDGIDIRDYTLKSLRSQISVVSQDVMLMNDSLLRNLAYGQKDISKERVYQALVLSDLADFVGSLPEGLETNIGDRGVKLSGGQRQRLAIARAAYRDAPILILDEATSALDNATEKRVQEALERLRKGRTTFIIAHRLSTIQSVTKIVVIDRGCVVGQGSHEQLLGTCSLYRQIAVDLKQSDSLGGQQTSSEDTSV